MTHIMDLEEAAKEKAWELVEHENLPTEEAETQWVEAKEAEIVDEWDAHRQPGRFIGCVMDGKRVDYTWEAYCVLFPEDQDEENITGTYLDPDYEHDKDR